MELLDWYVNLPARRVDLVGDYAGSELFLVEGDSLLLRCLSDPKLDFNEGFQLLHAVYAVEHFLQGLVQRKCNFHLVFFDEHEEACIPPNVAWSNRSKYLLARSVIIRHFQAHLPGTCPSISLRVFKSVQDSDFDDYLKSSAVYFMLCHDGAILTLTTEKKSTLKHDNSEMIRLEAEERSRKIVFRGLIYSMIKRGYNVALINGLEWMDTKVITMVVEGYRQAPIKAHEQPATLRNERAQSSVASTTIESFFSKLGFNTQATIYRNGDTNREANNGSPEDAFKSLTIGNPPVFSESACLALITLATILQKDASKGSFAWIFLVHRALIGETRISDRSQSSTASTDENLETSKLIDVFSVLSRSILDNRSWRDIMSAHSIKCDVADLIDGRLFNSVAADLQRHSFSKENKFAYLDQQVEDFVRVLEFICGINLDYHDQKVFSNGKPKKTSGLSTRSKRTELSILPFSNAIFDKHLRPIEISIDSSISFDRQSAKIIQEIAYWHSAKRRQDPKSNIPISDWDKSRALRRNQFFMAEMQAYAASLTSSAGKVLDPKFIAVADGKKNNKGYIESNKDSEDSASSKKLHNPKTTTNRKGAGKRSMMDDIAANKTAKTNEQLEKLFSSWQTVRKTLDSEPQLSSKYLKTKTYLRDLRWNDLPQPKRVILQAEIEFYILTILVDIYQSLCSKDEPRGSKKVELYSVAALIWDSIRKLSVSDGLTKPLIDHITQISRVLDLPTTSFPQPTSERKLTFQWKLYIPSSKDLSIGLKPVDFQCLHCGPYMDRNLDSAFDDRVPFEPDGWQRRVLDELDAERSVFVVAPTSAGKTFISFYAMEKILKANDEGVLVYVAPTKALVNQIAAEIQARYKKTYKHAGTSVWAVHTRDYRINNPSGCQILVTVPHILQIMLLSPSNAKSWSKNVKTIIFDEIHSIGNAEDGVIWEQLLLLAPCPIIALSATVGNPEKFSEWLGATQESSGNKLTMIKHQHRYSDLRKFHFVPPKHFTFSGLSTKSSFATLGLDGVEGLSFIHPVASLVNRSRGMPDDLSLEARDCLSLWQSMSKHQTPRFPVDSSLDPGMSALPKVIAKADIIKWEEKLKALLKTWMLNVDSPFDRVVEDLGKSTINHHAHDQVSRRHAADTAIDEAVQIDENDLFATTLPLLCKLHERDALPAIFFSYDRHKCEMICQAVVSQLIAAEKRWKERSNTWKKHLSDWEQWKKEQNKLAAKKAPKAAPKKRNKDDDDSLGSKADRIQDAANADTSPFASFDPDAPIDGFHFAAKHKVELSELDRDLSFLKKRGLPSWLIGALTRGIGVHHSGMNRKYRQVVEMLFRKGYLRVVIATGTLALGINMPCATVVFSGDSVFLTALNYRQAAGRAGRRGFDLLGNVVFQNMTNSKVCRLISSRLPDLNGHFPITTTLVLRLFALLHESGNSPYAIQTINSLLSQPRLYLDGLAFKDQVLHHLRFSIEYLRRQSLLSAQGAPLNFASLTSHLYYTENSCFALNTLLKDGCLHELCSDIKKKESNVLRTLMIVMAHLFGRVPCRQVDQEHIDTVVKRSPSVVFLPPLPSRAAQSLRQHNQDTLQIFTTYVKTFVDQHIDTDDCMLPLTEVAVGGHGDLGDLAKKLEPTKVRSAFVALSGHGDSFDNISDLCRTARGGVFLEEAVIPHLNVDPDEAKTPLNAYLYDFYMHGDLDALEKANNVRKSDVWFMLNDFSMVLATITASLANFLKLPNSDVNMLDIMGEGDERTNIEDDQFAADKLSDKGESGSASTASERGRIALPTASSAAKSLSKKKVADSWDDEDIEDEDSSSESSEEGADSAVAGSRSVEQMEEGFMNVYRAISKLRVEFNTKFKVIFA